MAVDAVAGPGDQLGQWPFSHHQQHVAGAQFIGGKQLRGCRFGLHVHGAGSLCHAVQRPSGGDAAVARSRPAALLAYSAVSARSNRLDIDSPGISWATPMLSEAATLASAIDSWRQLTDTRMRSAIRSADSASCPGSSTRNSSPP